MTHYDVLQVTQTASPEVIQMAYKALVKKYHPDVFQGDVAFATNKIKEINEAYRILSSPTLRHEYDKMINQSNSQRQQTSYNTNYNTQHTTSNSNHYTSNTNYNTQYTSSNSNYANTGRKSATNTKKIIIALIAILVIFFVVVVFDNSESNNTPEVPRPYSGDVLEGRKYYGESEITIRSSSAEDCVVKLKTASGVTKIMFYVRAGETVTVDVPAEYLYVYFASGDRWYGTEELFGKKTYYSKDDKICDFKKYTWEYTLTPVTNGNFSETPIDASEFN